MADENDIHVRPGRIGFGRPAQTATFLQRALRAAGQAGGMHAKTKRSPAFGRGRAGAAAAGRALVSRSRGAVVKARVVKIGRTPGALGAHLRYLCRDGTMRDGERGEIFGAEVDTSDGQAFADRCRNDRHHFRFIVSPDDAQDLQSLRTFTRDLMGQAEVDLGTKLDWVAADHWNTEHPHIHILVRGKTDRDQDLVISRDYIANGMRARASQLVTIELGPKTEIEMVRELERMTEADRWTRLDRELSRVAHDGVIDLRPPCATAKRPAAAWALLSTPCAPAMAARAAPRSACRRKADVQTPWRSLRPHARARDPLPACGAGLGRSHRLRACAGP